MQQTIQQVEEHVKLTRSEKPVVKEGKLSAAWYAVSDAMFELSGCAGELKDEHFICVWTRAAKGQKPRPRGSAI